MKNTWQMCLASKLRQIVVTLFILFPLFKTTAELCTSSSFPTDMLSGPEGSVPFVLACASGCIGRQLNDGTLSLVLSRPLKISQYALSKWMAVSIASIVVCLTQFTAEIIVALARTPYWVSAPDIIANGVERILVCVGFSAVFVFFSSLVSGSKDLAVYLVLYLLAIISGWLGQIGPETLPEGTGRVVAKLFVPVMGVIAQVLGYVLSPFIDFAPLLNGLPLSWTAFTAYFCVITIFLSFCIFGLNRRELPYGAD
jgi:hypothetical protein